MEITSIPLGKILPSPFNHRKKFDGLEELAASIKEKGLISPITVRPAPKGRSEPPFELVAGERRWKAAKIAGLTEIAAIVRDLDDKAVLEVQLIENVQRADVHPLEEADGYRALIDKHKHTVTTLAEKTGKSTSYIASRLKLCDLAPAPRKAFLAGELAPTIALAIARIPDAKLQATATTEVLGQTGDWSLPGSGIRVHELDTSEVVDEYGEGDDDKREIQPLTTKEALVHIQRRYMLRLELAPFDVADATLVAKAGACSACPKRTGNQRELFADVKSADVCTDPACFEQKKSADWDRKSAAAVRAGARVLTEKEAEKVFDRYGNQTGIAHDSAYVDPKGDLPYELQTKGKKTWQQLLGKATPATALAKDGSGAARTLWDKQSAIATAKKSGALKEAKAEKAARSSHGDTWKAQQARRQAEAKKRHAVARVAFARLAASKVAVDAKFWRWLGAALVEVLDAEDIRNWMKRHDLDAAGSGHSHASKVVAFINKAPESELPGVVVELVASFRSVGGLFAGSSYGKNFAATCAHFKVDLAKCKAEVVAAEKAKAAAKGKKK